MNDLNEGTSEGMSDGFVSRKAKLTMKMPANASCLVFGACERLDMVRIAFLFMMENNFILQRGAFDAKMHNSTNFGFGIAKYSALETEKCSSSL